MTRQLQVALAAVLACSSAGATANAMSVYLWKQRPVMVFAPSEADAALAEQKRIFAENRGGLVERDVVVIWVVGETVRADDGQGPGLSAAQLRARFKAQPDRFRVVLIGKDGGTKLVQSAPLATSTLFGTIDAMPMRAEEMRRGR